MYDVMCSPAFTSMPKGWLCEGSKPLSAPRTRQVKSSAGSETRPATLGTIALASCHSPLELRHHPKRHFVPEALARTHGLAVPVYPRHPQHRFQQLRAHQQHHRR
mmetsp:Transcript_36428/g.109799  ORF Transcript_36428/g.109799 Transcript_36428/m.109799 type:complete len:105 (-) Transcript_36428:585-899(-)